jgi:hypothetical protein
MIARKVFHHRDTHSLDTKILISRSERWSYTKSHYSTKVSWVHTEISEVCIEKTGWFFIRSCSCTSSKWITRIPSERVRSCMTRISPKHLHPDSLKTSIDIGLIRDSSTRCEAQWNISLHSKHDSMSDTMIATSLVFFWDARTDLFRLFLEFWMMEE